MTVELFIHRPKEMPVAPVAKNMETFNAGAVTIGVEFRIPTEEVLAAAGKRAPDPRFENLYPGGVSLHIFVETAEGESVRVRFDAFEVAPHYHYCDWSKNINDQVYIDPIVHRDVLAWSIETIYTRLPQMLQRAGVEDAEELVDRKKIEEILPLVTESAYRARAVVERDRLSRIEDSQQQRIA